MCQRVVAADGTDATEVHTGCPAAARDSDPIGRWCTIPVARGLRLARIRTPLRTRERMWSTLSGYEAYERPDTSAEHALPYKPPHLVLLRCSESPTTQSPPTAPPPSLPPMGRRQRSTATPVRSDHPRWQCARTRRQPYQTLVYADTATTLQLTPPFVQHDYVWWVPQGQASAPRLSLTL